MTRRMPATLALGREYAAFERLRTARRQYMTAFGGMAIVVILGALFNRVPRNEAVTVAGLLSVTPLWLWIVERFHWRRLVRRLDAERAELRAEKASSV